MYITKVLKRKDAASLVLAIILGFAISQAIFQVSYDLAGRLAFLGEDQPYGGANWRFNILVPIFTALSSILIIELLLRVLIPVRAKLVRRK